ncbi:Ig-like domain-containing protein, partial [Pseudomonas sp. SDO52101_S400]
VTVGTDYKWQSKFISIAVGSHRFTVKEKTGNQFESDPWEIERLAFYIVPTMMRLDGFSVKIPGWPKTGLESIGNTGVRVASGGVPPYDYASSSPNNVPVTQAGKVTGLKNDTATIYVTDQEGTTVTYLVAVTNVHELHISPTPLRVEDSVKWMNSLGGVTTFNSEFIRNMLRVYEVPVRDYFVWSCIFDGAYGRAIDANNGFRKIITSDPWISWCLKPI